MCMNYWDVGKVTRILVPLVALLIETPGAECQRSRPTCWLIAHLSLDEDESGDILEIFICFGAKASPSNGFGWVSGWRGVKGRNSTKLRQREEIHATCQMSFLHFGACMYIIFGYFSFLLQQYNLHILNWNIEMPIAWSSLSARLYDSALQPLPIATINISTRAVYDTNAQLAPYLGYICSQPILLIIFMLMPRCLCPEYAYARLESSVTLA